MSEKGFIEGFFLLFQRNHTRMFDYCFLKYTPYANSPALISELQWGVLSNTSFWSIFLSQTDPAVFWLKKQLKQIKHLSPVNVNVIIQDEVLYLLFIFFCKGKISPISLLFSETVFLAFISFYSTSFSECLVQILKSEFTNSNACLTHLFPDDNFFISLVFIVTIFFSCIFFTPLISFEIYLQIFLHVYNSLSNYYLSHLYDFNTFQIRLLFFQESFPAFESFGLKNNK